MKECPKCHSVVDAEYECKVCGESIFYEPFVDADRERIAKGYRLRYWLPKLWLSILASVLFLISLAVHRSIDKYVLMNAGFVLLGWLLVFFRSRFVQAMLWKYSEDYAKFDATISSIVIPVGSILMSVLLMLT
ncbi:MAG: hypothetical protein E7632_02315 [Ruminococcaceae bacterium]|nr:hypothetical protein [Oscillospiraceae bacterium]